MNLKFSLQICQSSHQAFWHHFLNISLYTPHCLGPLWISLSVFTQSCCCDCFLNTLPILNLAYSSHFPFRILPPPNSRCEQIVLIPNNTLNVLHKLLLFRIKNKTPSDLVLFFQCGAPFSVWASLYTTLFSHTKLFVVPENVLYASIPLPMLHSLFELSGMFLPILSTW